MFDIKKFIKENVDTQHKRILAERNYVHGSPPIDGKSKRNAANWIHSKTDKYIKGFFSDNYWTPIHSVFKEFDKLELDWNQSGARYEEERVTFPDGSSQVIPVRKIWTFEIGFLNNRDKADKLYGRIVAAGAGPHISPLDKYDVTMTVS